MSRYNPVGPNPSSSGNSSSLLENWKEAGTKLSEKWIAAALISLFGGSIAYLIYNSRRGRGGDVNRVSNGNRQQQPNRNTSGNTEFAYIQGLPTEIRTRIWQALPYDDRLRLRLTSQFTKDDIDTFVGVSGRVTTADIEKYEFFQNVALSSCKITELQLPIDQDFFVNPGVLQTLEIREYAPIPLANIQALLGVAVNLKYLKLRINLSENVQEISQSVLEHLPNMKFLTFLHVKTRTRMIPGEMKNYKGCRLTNFSYSSPKSLKNIHLEMSDLPVEEIVKWKVVLDKQDSLERLIANFGNVNWRFYEIVLRRNAATLEKLVLEGIRGWNLERGREDPFDWSVFSQFISLKSVDLCCNRSGGGADNHDLVTSINFDRFPCFLIEEFFISRILLSPPAVERIYRDMINLQRGALDNIGNQGIERANEMAWLVLQGNQQQQETEGWWEDERIWEYLSHGIFGVSMAIVLAMIIKRSGHWDENSEGAYPSSTFGESSENATNENHA